MTEPRPLRIAVCNKADPLSPSDWKWILPELGMGSRLTVRSYAVAPNGVHPSLRERRAAFAGTRRLWRDHAERPFDLILSFVPASAMWVELCRSGRAGRHMCFGFNFTMLPSGLKLTLMRRALRRLERAFVFTEAERSLYASAFDLPTETFVRVPWGVAPPLFDDRPTERGYVSALGGEARDYAVLAAAAAMLPHVAFEVVARPHNIAGIDFPPNVTVHTDLPSRQAWSIVAASDAHVLPLVSRHTPCGIVTAVGAMHLGKAQLATRACGLTDYLVDDEHALLVEAGSAAKLAGGIDRLTADRELRARLGRAAKERATEAFSEAATESFARDLVGSLQTDRSAST